MSIKLHIGKTLQKGKPLYAGIIRTLTKGDNTSGFTVGKYLIIGADGVLDEASVTAPAWGAITGTITDQTDLVSYVTSRLGSYVPYTGATASVALGSFGLSGGTIQPTTDNTYNLGVEQSKEYANVYTRRISGNNNRMVLEMTSSAVILRDHDTVGEGVRLMHRGQVVAYMGDGSGNAYAGFGTATPTARVHTQSPSATTIGHIVQGAAAQSANLHEWRNSAGTTLSSVSSDGRFIMTSAFTTSPAYTFSGDTDTGIARIADNTVGIYAGGSLRYQFAQTSSKIYSYDGTLVVLEQGFNGLDMNPNQSTGVSTWMRNQYGVVLSITGNRRGIAMGTYNSNPSAIAHIKTTSATFPCAIFQGTAAQSANLSEWQNDAGTLLSYVDKNGAVSPASMTDGSAANNTVYYSTTAGKLVYKDSSGTVNNLY